MICPLSFCFPSHCVPRPHASSVEHGLHFDTKAALSEIRSVWLGLTDTAVEATLKVGHLFISILLAAAGSACVDGTSNTEKMSAPACLSGTKPSIPASKDSCIYGLLISFTLFFST